MDDLFDRLRNGLPDRYRLVREIGRGGMSVVYLARETQDEFARDVAIKALRPELLLAGPASRFLQEIQITSQLAHPNILPLHHAGLADGLLYYVTPYVERGSLRDWLTREGPLSITDVLDLARQIAGGLEYAHAARLSDGKGVVHRDIKPENILLAPGGRAWLADFGIARVLSHADENRLSEYGIVIGTLPYMSPEQCAGDRRIDSRSDIYALACVVYEMLVGSPPFTGPSNAAISAKHLHERPPSLRVVRPDIPLGVQGAVEKALAKMPADRFATAGAFADALLRERPPVPVLPTIAKWTALVGLSAAVTFAAYTTWFDGGTGSKPALLDPSHVAVLYFDDNSAGTGHGHVAKGLTETLIDELRRVPTLSVVSPNGVKAFSGKGIPLDSIARTLNVGTIVEGSLAVVGPRVRATVRLVDGSSGKMLEGETIDRASGELFRLQDDLGRQVSEFLRMRLGTVITASTQRKRARDPEAWELLQRADQLRDDAEEAVRAGHRDLATSTLRRADSLLARAYDRDRSWVDPLVLRGWIAADIATSQVGEDGKIDTTLLRRASDFANRALAVDPASVIALELRGAVGYRLTLFGANPSAGDLAERDLRAAAVPENPFEARAWQELSQLLQATGKPAEANEAARRAYEADAFLAEANSVLFRLYDTSLDLERPADADRWCQEGRARFPADWQFAFCRLTLMVWKESTVPPDVAAARILLEDLERLAPKNELPAMQPRFQMMLAGVVARAGNRANALALIRSTRAAGSADPQLDYWEALARLNLNQPDSAVALLEKMLQSIPQFRSYIAVNPFFKSLRSNPRFSDLTASQ